MTPEEQIAKMTKAINQAIQALKESLPQPAAAPKPKPAETKPAEAIPAS